MMSVLLSLPAFYNSYQKWVSSNPQFVGDVESSFKWISYFVAGRMQTSNIISELIYSISNLLVLLNDEIIRRHCQPDINRGTASTLKLLLTTLEYCEVFIELSAKQLWGKTGKWGVIVLLQLCKCFGRLVLLFRYKDNIIQTPPIPPLKRSNMSQNSTPASEQTTNVLAVTTFTLKRSGRLVRKVESAPPKALRTWIPPLLPVTGGADTRRAMVCAEALYVIKPVIHLSAMRWFGTKAWKSWLVAFGADAISLHLYFSSLKASPDCITQKHRLELSRRSMILVLYLLRSPFYERHSRDRLDAFLQKITNIPLIGGIISPLMLYLPHWQDTYFYMWST